MPDDAPINRILAVLLDKMSFPQYAPDGQPLSYKFHHRASGKATYGRADAVRCWREGRGCAEIAAGDYGGRAWLIHPTSSPSGVSGEVTRLDHRRRSGVAISVFLRARLGGRVFGNAQRCDDASAKADPMRRNFRCISPGSAPKKCLFPVKTSPIPPRRMTPRRQRRSASPPLKPPAVRRIVSIVFASSAGGIRAACWRKGFGCRGRAHRE